MRKTCLFLSVRVNYPIKFIIRSVEKKRYNLLTNNRTNVISKQKTDCK